jgi:hypothetical protein
MSLGFLQAGDGALLALVEDGVFRADVVPLDAFAVGCELAVREITSLACAVRHVNLPSLRTVLSPSTTRVKPKAVWLAARRDALEPREYVARAVFRFQGPDGDLGLLALAVVTAGAASAITRIGIERLTAPRS